jgi:chemosensory pili system protein ChpA (sensor histidine kinase/response regulator)
MKMRNSALEKVAVKKVKCEVDAIIEEARAKLEEYVENESDTSLLTEVSTSLVQVERTLQLVHINGAAVLAREMCDVIDGLIDDSIQQQDKAQECLSRGILQMSDYLEYVQAGNKDLPVVLLPLLNDLRGVREAPLLSEHILFFPDLDDIAVPAVSAKIGMPAQEYAKKIRYGYQIGLVGIIQNKEIDIAATKMCKVAIRLHQCSTENASRRLWWVTSAIAQALAIEGLTTSMGLASLLGQVDRQIKQFIVLDESSFASQISSGLIKNLLYYVGIAQDRGRIVSKVKQAYGLGDLIPNEMDIDKMREGMSGPSADVLEAVSKALHEDIETVKDLIEVYVHSKNRSSENISVVSAELQKIADTLSMLGLDEPREDMMCEVNALNGLSAEELEHADSHLMVIAETLIKTENIVENFVNYRVLNKPVVQVIDSTDGNSSSSGDSNQLRIIQIQTITEALSEIEEAKNKISQLLTSPDDEDVHADVQDHFRKVIGALSMLNLDDAAMILECIQAYLLGANATQELSSQADKLDAFADSITSVECYLEALIVDEGDPKEILEYGVSNTSKLVSNEIELSNNPETLRVEPLQTVEVAEFAEEDDSLVLLSADDLELKKKPKPPEAQI